MKKLLFILMAMALFSCCGKNYRVAKITHGETEKKIEVCWGDTTITDTVFYVAPEIPDTTILKQLRQIEDSLRAVFVKDSLYKEFQQDSINFRKITKKINGGYNGWEYRYKLWLNARKVLKLNIEEDKK